MKICERCSIRVCSDYMIKMKVLRQLVRGGAMRTKFFARKVIKAEKSLLLAAIGMFAILVPLRETDASWIKTYGVNAGNIPALAVSGTTIFAGTGSGVFRSTNNGSSWTMVILASDIQSLAVRDSNIFAGTYGHGVLLSANNGTNWESFNKGLTDTIIMSITVSDNNIFAGTRTGVFLSINNDTSWTAVNNGLPANSQITSFAVNGTGDIFAGSYGYGVFLSTNNGISWTAVNNGLLVNPPIIFCLAMNGGNIFASSIITPANGGGVFLSTNSGASWTSVNNGLPVNNCVQSIAGCRGLIFAGIQRKGVFFSADDGATWKAINDGLTDTNVLSLAMNDSTLFAGTTGSVWLRPLSEIVTPVKLSVKVKYDYFAGGVTYHVFSWNPVSGAAWYDLYGNNVRFSHVLNQPRDSLKVSIGTISDSIEKETGKQVKVDDTLTYYLVARSSTNQILAVSNFVHMPFQFLVGTRPHKTLEKAPGFRISGPLIDCSSLKGTVRVTLYSLSGEKLWEKNGFGIKTMVPDQLSRGVYTVEVIGAFGKASRVVVRE